MKIPVQEEFPALVSIFTLKIINLSTAPDWQVTQVTGRLVYLSVKVNVP